MSPQSSTGAFSLLRHIILPAFLYILGIKIGEFLNMPWTQTSLFWPAAGIAFGLTYCYGLRCLLGIGIAYIGFFVYMLHPPQHEQDTYTYIDIAVRAFGTILQAGIGAWLIKKTIGPAIKFETLEEIGKFSILAGPGSCLISSLIGMASLYFIAGIHYQNELFSWLTWYVGDIFGVLLVGPLTVLLLHKREDVSLRRKLQVTLPVLCIFIILAALFHLVMDMNKRAMIREFEAQNQNIQDAFDLVTESSIKELSSLQYFFMASEYVSPSEFETFLQWQTQKRDTAISFILAPEIPLSEKSAFERWRAGPKESKLFPVSRLKNTSGAQNSDKKDGNSALVFYPVAYSVQDQILIPYSLANHDLSSEPVLSQTIQEVKENAHMKTSSLFQLSNSGHASENDGKSNLYEPWIFMFAAPIYAPGAPLGSQAQKEHAFRGVVISLHSLSRLLDKVMKGWQRHGIYANVYRIDPQTGKQIFVMNSRTGPNEPEDFSKTDPDFISLLQPVLTGANWWIEIYKAPDYISQNVQGLLWGELAGGFIFLCMILVLLLYTTAHTAMIERLVKEKTHELVKQTKFLQLIIDNVPNFILVKNRFSEVITANKLFKALLPPETQIIGKRYHDLLPRELMQQHIEMDEQTILTGSCEGYEDITDYSGLTRHMHMRSVLFHADNSYEPYILVVGQDVTALMRTQNELKAILNSTAEGLLTFDSRGRILTYNNACEKIFGYSFEEATGEPAFKLLARKTSRKDYSGFLRFIRRYRKHLLNHALDLYAKDAKGRIFPIKLSLAEVVVGRTKIFSAIIRDMTEEYSTQEGLKRSIEELENFAYITSHDLKTPLRHLSISAEFLREEYKELFDEKAQYYIDTIYKDTLRMQAMIDSLLAYSSVGKQGVILEEVPLNDIINEACDICREEIKSAKAKIEIGDLPTIKGNRSLLLQLFQNLISNALKYRKARTKPKIKIFAKSTQHGWHIRIEDNGIGIDPVHKDKIFQIFMRLHDDKTYEGTGIGLAISRRIAEFHGATLTLDTEYNNGAAFIIKF